MHKSINAHVLPARIQGALHRLKGIPCQDAYCYKRLKNKFIAVVSDGAGSAKHGKTGARIICTTLCDLLANSNLQNIQSDVVRAINIARQKLVLHRQNKSKSTDDLYNFSATLLGVFYSHGKGIFFHIGDGAGLAFCNDALDNLIISEPQNGAFSCETFFYTMDNWQENLRFTEFENMNRIMLMTDGVTSFVFADDFYRLQKKFLEPIVKYLENENNKSRALQALRNTLNDSRAQHINADDKTLLWAKIS